MLAEMESMVDRKVSNFKHLKDLDYFVGEWKETGEWHIQQEKVRPFVYHKHCTWTLGKNYLQSTTTEEKDGTKEVIHKSLIGWNKEAEEIMAWGFWRFGFHETCSLVKEGNAWKAAREDLGGVITILDNDTYEYRAEFTLPDGRKGHWHYKSERQ